MIASPAAAGTRVTSGWTDLLRSRMDSGTAAEEVWLPATHANPPPLQVLAKQTHPSLSRRSARLD